MTHVTTNVSACRRCSYYRSEGRRSGQCDLLGASVQGQWSACAAAKPLFELPIAPKGAIQAIALKNMVTLTVAPAALEPESALEPELVKNIAYYETSLGDLEDTPEEIEYLALSSRSR